MDHQMDRQGWTTRYGLVKMAHQLAMWPTTTHSLAVMGVKTLLKDCQIISQVTVTHPPSMTFHTRLAADLQDGCCNCTKNQSDQLFWTTEWTTEDVQPEHRPVSCYYSHRINSSL